MLEPYQYAIIYGSLITGIIVNAVIFWPQNKHVEIVRDASTRNKELVNNANHNLNSENIK